MNLRSASGALGRFAGVVARLVHQAAGATTTAGGNRLIDDARAPFVPAGLADVWEDFWSGDEARANVIAGAAQARIVGEDQLGRIEDFVGRIKQRVHLVRASRGVPARFARPARLWSACVAPEAWLLRLDRAQHGAHGARLVMAYREL